MATTTTRPARTDDELAARAAAAAADAVDLELVDTLTDLALGRPGARERGLRLLIALLR